MALELRGAAAMALTASAASGFLLLLLCVPGLLAQWPWSNCTSSWICALNGSTTDISCAYPSPYTVDQIFWSCDNIPQDIRERPEYAGRVKYICGDGNTCTLRIADLRQSDAALYRFSFTKNPGHSYLGDVTYLTVTGLKVQRQYSEHSSEKRADVECQTSCKLPNNPTFIWYKNGEKLMETRSSRANDIQYEDGDGVVCAVRGHQDLHSAPLCLGGESCNHVTYTERNICAFKGSSVNISCTYSSSGSVVSAFWYSPGRGPHWENSSQPEDLRDDAQYEGRVEVFAGEGGRSILRITELRESDTAQYRFKFITSSFEWKSHLPAPTLTVTDVQMQVTRTNLGPSETEAELKCVSSCSPAAPVSFVWLKNGQSQHRGETFSGWFLPGDEIYCALDGHEDCRSPSLYAPEVPSVNASVSPDDMVEGRAVTLSCGGNGDTVKISWHKQDEKADIRAVGAEPQLLFDSIKSSDSGEYYCRAESQLGNRNSESITVEVKYPPRDPSVSVVPSGDISVGSTVTLTCSSDANPAANYSWFKENESSPRASGHTFIITKVTSNHGGDYYCEATNSRGSQRVGFSLPLVSDTWIYIVAATAAVSVSLVAILVAVFKWIRRKRRGSYEARRRAARSWQDHLRSAPILFSNMAAAGLQTCQQQKEDGAGKASVQLGAGGSAPSNVCGGGGTDERSSLADGPSAAAE